jgi:hypothetical protein
MVFPLQTNYSDYLSFIKLILLYYSSCSKHRCFTPLRLFSNRTAQEEHMLQLVRFKGCVHVYDTNQRRFLKATTRRVLEALQLPAQTPEQCKTRSRARILKEAAWTRCPGCLLGETDNKDSKKKTPPPPPRPQNQPKVHDHWFAGK